MKVSSKSTTIETPMISTAKCLLFEFRGIICRHSLVVLAQERQQCVLPKYVLQRWNKTVRRRHSYIRSSLNAKEKLPHMLYVKGFPRSLRLPVKKIKQQIYYFANWKPLPNVIVFLYSQLDSTAVLHMQPPTQSITTTIVMTT